ncbi:MAG: hypothetical protein KatS3mg107_0052 [Gemmataceae bacterium]|uniref:Uncharacterized protein n=1 Tax=Thermogemmata fonticola TaxID=2755323 RepID=A0A7V8VBT1_9BACT|nr:hypothetical protein [Thermogemmata fonticola]MBA2225148.1 hypothetical protein [Thermogemmata fonticola]GIW84392.1 MAG: hypothetical protein KatS3mg107_0052 [Gemmataceae bacterium]
MASRGTDSSGDEYRLRLEEELFGFRQCCSTLRQFAASSNSGQSATPAAATPAHDLCAPMTLYRFHGGNSEDNLALACPT